MPEWNTFRAPSSCLELHLCQSHAKKFYGFAFSCQKKAGLYQVKLTGPVVFYISSMHYHQDVDRYLNKFELHVLSPKNLVKIGPVILEKKNFKFVNCVFAFSCTTFFFNLNFLRRAFDILSKNVMEVLVLQWLHISLL